MADDEVAAAKAKAAAEAAREDEVRRFELYSQLVKRLDSYGLKGGLTMAVPGLDEKIFVAKCKHFVPWLERMYHCLQAQDEPTHQDNKNQYYFEKGIIVESITWFGKPNEAAIGFAKIQADLMTREKYTAPSDGTKPSKNVEKKIGQYGRKPGAVFLRGGSVAILMVLQVRHPDGSLDPPQVVVARQARVPTGSFDFVELPAGMVDVNNEFSGTAADEIRQEIGIVIPEKDLFDMTKATFDPEGLRNGSEPPNPRELHDAFYPSMGACDEYIRVFYYGRYVTPTQLATYKGKATGEFKEGEDIILDIVPLKDLWRVAGRDGKAHAALSMYYGLKSEGWEFKMKPIQADAY